MSRLMVIDTGLRGARRNVALTAAMVEMHGRGRIPDMLRLYHYPRCVLIGRSQSLEQALSVEDCRSRGLEIARRISGGGAVYMAPGILAWDLVVSRDGASAPQALASRIAHALCTMLAVHGLQAQFRRPGDVMVAGRKVSGSAGLMEGRTLLHQGTLVLEADLVEMAAVLGLSTPAPEVGTLDEFAGRPFPRTAATEAIARAVSGSLGSATFAGFMPPDVERLADRLLSEQFGRDDFVYDERSMEPAR